MCVILNLVRPWSILDYAGQPLSRHVVSDVGLLVRFPAGFNMQVLMNLVQKNKAPEVGVSQFYTAGYLEGHYG